MKNAIVLTGMLAIAGIAVAQTKAQMPSGPEGGQASTVSPAGEPNPTQRPSGAMPESRADVKAGASAQSQMPQTTNVPSGEASTKVEGRPNETPAVGAQSREMVKEETKQDMQTNSDDTNGAASKAKVPTNPGTGEGTPK